MNDVIISSRNPLVKDIKALHRKKSRNQTGRFFVEGIKIIDEALRYSILIDYIVVSEEFALKHPSICHKFHSKGIRVHSVSDSLYREISDTQTPQGIMAVVYKRQFLLENLLRESSYFLVVLDQIQDPGNMGTIIRTVDAASGDGVVLLDGCADPYNPKTLRATMGSIFRVPIYMTNNFHNFFTCLRDKGTNILVSHLEGDNLFKWQGELKKIALVIGNESSGVRSEVKDYAASLIKIPIPGGAESLNASVAAGILIYEVIRKACYKDS